MALLGPALRWALTPECAQTPLHKHSPGFARESIPIMGPAQRWESYSSQGPSLANPGGCSAVSYIHPTSPWYLAVITSSTHSLTCACAFSWHSQEHATW